MTDQNASKPRRAASFAATSFGFLAGVGGVTHGIGEILQGNLRPDGIIINSWTQGPIAETMGGEPGMTLVPNLFLTGVLCVAISLVLMIWALVFVRGKRGGAIQILLSIGMLLVGGGFGPPLIGILSGIAGIGIQAPQRRLRAQLSGRPGRWLAALWPLVFGISLLNAIFLFIGSTILVYLFQVDNQALFLNSFYFAIVSVLLTLITGRAYDLQPKEKTANTNAERTRLPEGRSPVNG